MMKIAVLLALLFVSIHAIPFQHLGGNNPYNLDTPDDGQQGGQVNVAGQAQDEPDDDGQAGQAAAPQGGTTLAPVSPGADSSSSSSSSSEEDAESEAGGTGTTAPPAGPIQGQGAAGGQNAGDSSQGNVEAAVGGPMQAPGAQPGDTSKVNLADPGGANPLQPQAVKQQTARRSEAAIALTTMLIVAGVAATSVVAYKYKDVISARLGL